MSEPVIVLIDDDEDLCRYCQAALKPLEARVVAGHSVADGRRLLESENADLLLVDLELPDGTGLDLLRDALNADPQLVVTLITGKATVKSAIEAMKEGAFDYLLKPLPPMELRANVRKALAHRSLLLENKDLRRRLKEQAPDRTIIGAGAAIRNVLRLVDKVAPHDTTLLLTGESGTGKELVAWAVHRSSPRGENPFVAVNCSALPETLLESELFGHVKGAFTGATSSRKGLFVQANGGTLLLDEIGDMPASLQAKLLRVLEEQRIRPVGSDQETQVDVRVIAATNSDLGTLVRDKKFRQDLFFRIRVMELPLPPLRERREDISLLAQHFLDKAARGGAVSKLKPEVLRLFEEYQWPGNVRELSNVIERACLLADGEWITPDLLPRELLSQASAPSHAGQALEDSTLAELEEVQIRRILKSNQWSRTRAADALGISRRTLYNKMKQYGIDPPSVK